MFKPLLAGRVESMNELRYPCLASIKLDGVRATIQGGKVMSRTLKPIPNLNVQAAFSVLPEGIDGELIAGDPYAPDAYRKTTSIVMSDDNPLGDVRFHVFDQYGPKPFENRIEQLAKIVRSFESKMPISLVEHIVVHSAEELQQALEFLISKGAEGIMTRRPDGKYKQGRSSPNEQSLIKHKLFADGDFEIIGTFELMHNSNPAMVNALGRTQRSTAKAGKVGRGTLGGFNLKDNEGKFENFDVGTGFDDAERARLWEIRDDLIGTFCKVKFFPSGGDSRPRFPVYLGQRDKRDIS